MGVGIGIHKLDKDSNATAKMCRRLRRRTANKGNALKRLDNVSTAGLPSLPKRRLETRGIMTFPVMSIWVGLGVFPG